MGQPKPGRIRLLGVGPEPAVGKVRGGPAAEMLSGVPTNDNAGPSWRLLAKEVHYTDAELLTALRVRLAELEERASELDLQVAHAELDLGKLVVQARTRAGEVERGLVADLVPWARRESAAIVDDARRRAAELGVSPETSSQLQDLGRLLISHFELEEQLVRLVAKLALEGPSPGGVP